MRPLKKRKRKAKRTGKPLKIKEKHTQTRTQIQLFEGICVARLGENEEKREERELDLEGLLRDLKSPTLGEGKWNG